jgi:hypothetical protein
MGRWTLARLLGFTWALFGITAVSFAADPLSALDLLSHDVALCIEIPRLEETWAKLETSPLMDRLRAFPPSRHFFESDGIRRWRIIEERVAEQTGQNLTEQLRSLYAKSLVVAMYVPAEGPPRGILIGEATSDEAIKTAFATWNTLEPNAVMIKKTHHGGRYLQRKKSPAANDCLFFAASERWFAISDHESLIQDVIDRFLAAIGDAPPVLGSSLRRSNAFARNRERLKRNAAAYVHIGARPWDRGLQELSESTKSRVSPASVWKHVSVVSASLQFDNGIVCDTVVELDKSNLPSEWSQVVSTGSGPATWNQRVPAEAILAFGGHVELVPFARLLLNQILPGEQNDFAKCRREAQELLGGRDLVEGLLPALTRNFCGYVAPVTDAQTKQVTLDGMIDFTVDSPADAQFLQEVGNRGLEAAVKLLAAYFSAGAQDIVVVDRERTATAQFCSTDSSSFPIALGMSGQNLVIGGSRERVRRWFDTQASDDNQSRLADHSRRYFSNANQLIWFDVAQTRKLLYAHQSEVAKLFANASEDDKKRFASNVEQLTPTLELVDSLFLAGRIEYDHVRFTFGGGLDTK